MTEFGDIDEFLGHSAGGARRGGAYMRGWKDKGFLNFWLHMRRLPMAFWAHQFPYLSVFEDKTTRVSVTAFFSRSHVCWEDEATLKNQFGRDRKAPTKCALCRLVGHVDQMIKGGLIKWTEPLFRFEGATDPNENKVIHAGGLVGDFQNQKLTTEELQDLSDHRIYPSEAWRENGRARCNYVFCVVDQDDIRAGVRILTEGVSIGGKVQKVIADSRISRGDEAGNPFLHPFCFQVTYDKAKMMNDRYHARRMERYTLTPELEGLLKSDPPDLSGVTRPFDQAALRPFLERYAVVDLPWDEIFKVPALVAPGEVQRPEAPVRLAQPQVKTIPCDQCKHPMREDEAKCPKCGALYDLDTPSVVMSSDIPF